MYVLNYFYLFLCWFLPEILTLFLELLYLCSWCWLFPNHLSTCLSVAEECPWSPQAVNNAALDKVGDWDTLPIHLGWGMHALYVVLCLHSSTAFEACRAVMLS